MKPIGIRWAFFFLARAPMSWSLKLAKMSRLHIAQPLPMTTGLFTSLPGLSVRPSKDDPNPLVIYHGHCSDGFGAALAAWLYFEGQGEYLPLVHGKVTQVSDLPPLEGRAVYILDFSFEEPLLQALDELAAKLVVLDHHQSAADKIGQFQCRCGAVHFDMTQSGAMLGWKFFHPERPAPDLIRYIQDRDLWTWAYPDSAAFLAALDMEPQDFARWAEVAAFTPEQSAAYCQRGTAMARSPVRWAICCPPSAAASRCCGA
jgi:hypothetical protein